MTSIFAPPLPVFERGQSGYFRRKAKAKEEQSRRSDVDDSDLEQDDNYSNITSRLRSSRPVEYTAVLSPDERVQRRLAGQPLDETPPAKPFPHAKAPWTELQGDHSYRPLCSLRSSDKKAPVTGSLHSQHLSSLTAILHRSLLRKDFHRASWALGLILREQVNGQSIDIRSQGNWGIGAEILLRKDVENSLDEDERVQNTRNEAHKRTPLPYSIKSFEKVKRYYENLIIQFPYTKFYPNATNSVDFYLAMFNLWIYIVQAENDTDGNTSTTIDGGFSSSSNPLLESGSDMPSLHKLEQAQEIANRIDSCMDNVPYIDNEEFIRLRAMVALWIADLNDICAQDLAQARTMLPNDFNVDQDSDQEGSSSIRYSKQAEAERIQAQRLLSKLEQPGAEDDEDE